MKKVETIQINEYTRIDLGKLIDSRLLVQANSGGGKSWALRRLLEQSHGKVQHIIIDPEGEFGTLREKYDYILVGKDGDIPADSRTAAMLALRVLEHKFSVIIDLYEMLPQERKHFVRLFLESLIQSPKELWNNCLVVVDEAHTFVPEKGDSEAANAVIGLASLGRKRGFCAVLATQRISKLHKDAAAECNNKLIGRASLDIDRKRSSEELGFNTKEQNLSLRNLAPGEFFGFGPAISNEITRFQIGPIETSHPKAGSYKVSKVKSPTKEIKDILSKLTDLPAEAKKEAQTTIELKNENAQLKTKINKLEKYPLYQVETSPKAITDAVWKSGLKWEKIVKSWQEYARKCYNTLHSNGSIIMKDVDKLSSLEPKIIKPIDEMTPSNIISARLQPLNNISTKELPVRNGFSGVIKSNIDIADLRDISITKDIVSQFSSLGKGEIIILQAICQFHEGISNEHIAVLTGYKTTSRRSYLQRLRAKGYIEEREDLYFSTDSGISALGSDFEPLPQGDALREYWSRRLTGGEKVIFDILVAHYPDEVSFEIIEEMSGYKTTSRRSYLQRLGARKLVIINGQSAKINDTLYG